MESNYLEETLERLAAATIQLERTIAGMEERHAHVCGDVERIVATAGESQEASRSELVKKLAEAEQKLVRLQAEAETNTASRRTIAAAATPMLSKNSMHLAGNLEAGTLDAALAGLSLEQRIAVKSQLTRAGAIG